MLNTAVVVALAVVGAVTLIDFILSVAIIRRLRDYERRIAGIGTTFPFPDSGLPPGSQVPVTTVTTVNGQSVDLADHDSVLALAFLSAACDACSSHLDEFLAIAVPSRPYLHRLVIIADDHDGNSPLASRAGLDIPTLRASEGARVTAAFDVSAFPTFYLVESGMIVTKAPSVRALERALRHSTETQVEEGETARSG